MKTCVRIAAILSTLQVSWAAEAVVSAAGSPTTTAEETEGTPSVCQDLSEGGTKQCQQWALSGECEKNKEYMEYGCAKTCGFCESEDGEEIDLCVDLSDQGEVQCREWAWVGECKGDNKDYMEVQCRKSCGLCEPKTTPACEDAFAACPKWATDGLCTGPWEGTKGPITINAAYIVEFCPVSCGTCNIHLDERDWKLGMGFPQTAPDFHEWQGMEQRVKGKVADTARYMLTLPEDIRSVCKFGHINCARMTLDPAECERNADHYVYKYLCASACRDCEKFADPEERAEVEAHYKEALKEAEAYMAHQKKNKGKSRERDPEFEWY